MRKIVLAASIASVALTLAACSQGTDDSAEPAAEAEANTDAPAEDVASDANAVIDANTVTAAQLAGANGVSPELAAAIVAGQPYDTVVDLNATLRETLSEEQAATVLETVFVPVNLNTASEAEIELIPGVGPRMRHEFEEYRPYTSIEQFRREIGKYVDSTEVARLERYVTIR